MNKPRPLTKDRLTAIQARIQPGNFLRKFADQLETHGEEMLRGLFEIAAGHVTVKERDGAVYDVSVSDRLAAVRLIMELGAFKEVTKTLLKIAAKGRPVDGSDAEIPEWAARYGADEDEAQD